MKTKIALALIALGLVALVGLRLRQALRPKQAGAAVERQLITTARVVRADLPVAVRMTGTVRPRNEVEIFPKVSGRIESVHAQVGDQVKAGQLLAWIEHKELAWQARAAEAALSVARANLEGAKLDFDRTKTVFEGGAAAQAQLDGARVKLELAQAQVAQAEAAAGLARQQLANARIESPVAGTVTRRPVNVGAQVGAQTLLFTVQDVVSLKLESSVDAPSFHRLAKAQPATVTVDGIPEPFSGKVSLLSPALDPQSRRAAVEIEIDNSSGKLLPNMFAHVDVGVKPLQGALVLPREALLESAGGAIVYRVKGDRVEAVRPTLGEGDDRRVAVTAGLAEGDLVSTSGLPSLSDGAAVKLADQAPAGSNVAERNR